MEKQTLDFREAKFKLINRIFNKCYINTFCVDVVYLLSWAKCYRRYMQKIDRSFGLVLFFVTRGVLTIS